MTYPRSHNGHVDDGSLIKAANRRDTCPNCGSHSYRETVSMESCLACGLRMDYWGGGGNTVYDQYEAKRAAQARQKEWNEQQAYEQSREWYLGSDDTQD